jgi:hypothetical protein
MSTTSATKIERSRNLTGVLDHVSDPWACDLRKGEAVCCFAPGGGT